MIKDVIMVMRKGKGRGWLWCCYLSVAVFFDRVNGVARSGFASLREKLIKIGAKVVSHGRYVTFQMAEVAVPRQMFADILSLIAGLRAPPAPA
jgi:hypothetical protein